MGREDCEYNKKGKCGYVGCYGKCAELCMDDECPVDVENYDPYLAGDIEEW